MTDEAKTKCPGCGKDDSVKAGNKYCSWECGSSANKFTKKAYVDILKDIYGGGAGAGSASAPMGVLAKDDQPCANPGCDSYGTPHPDCRCYGGQTTEKASELMNPTSVALSSPEGLGQPAPNSPRVPSPEQPQARYSSDMVKSLREIVPGTLEHLAKELDGISKEASGFHSAMGPRGAPVMVNPKTGEKEYGHNAKRIQHVKEHGDMREQEGKYERTKDLKTPHGHRDVKDRDESGAVAEKSCSGRDMPLQGAEGMMGKAHCLNMLASILGAE